MAAQGVPQVGQASKLLNRVQVAEGTMAFHFLRPPEFQFRAGQAIDVTLLNPPETDAEGNTRTFSIASSPYDEELVVATRMRDTAFKRVLREAAFGTEVKIEGPTGSFVLHRNSAKPAVFLAGGIGITPFRSIILQAAHDMAPHQLYLFYSNRCPEDAAFLNVLTDATVRNSNFHLIGTMTEMDKSQRDWKGERGYIDERMLSRHLPLLQGPIYYLAGPPAMVAAMRQTLTKAGVDEDDVRTEEFSGY